MNKLDIRQELEQLIENAEYDFNSGTTVHVGDIQELIMKLDGYVLVPAEIDDEFLSHFASKRTPIEFYRKLIKHYGGGYD